MLLSYAITLVYVVLDIKDLHRSPSSDISLVLVVISLFAAIGLVSGSSHHGYHVEYSDAYCPDICFGDLTIYKRFPSSVSSEPPISVNDMVVRRIGNEFGVSKILGVPRQTICYKEGRAYAGSEKNSWGCLGSIYLKNDNYFIQNDDPFYYSRDNSLLKGYIKKNDIVGTSPMSLMTLPGILLYLSIIFD